MKGALLAKNQEASMQETTEEMITILGVTTEEECAFPEPRRSQRVKGHHNILKLICPWAEISVLSSS